MLREIAAALPPAARLLRIVVAAFVAVTITGCGIKGPLRQAPAPSGAATGAAPTPSPAATPQPGSGASEPDATPRR